MTKILTYIGIAVLVVIAIVLGYIIIKQQSITPQVSTDNSTATAPTTNQLSAAEEIAAVLNFPGPNATDAEIKKHLDLVDKLGNESTILDISGCKPNPVVFRIRLGANFKVKNSDQIAHVIYTYKELTINANSEQSLDSASVSSGLGNRGYSCDNGKTTVGVIQIIP